MLALELLRFVLVIQKCPAERPSSVWPVARAYCPLWGSVILPGECCALILSLLLLVMIIVAALGKLSRGAKAQRSMSSWVAGQSVPNRSAASRPLCNLLQRTLIILDELPDSVGREFMHNIKVLPWLVQVQGFVRDWFE